MPNNLEQNTLLRISAANNSYGSVLKNNLISSASVFPARRVIYCVHGKPSAGCCKVSEGEIVNIEPNDDNITNHTKENMDTTELVNKHCHQTDMPDIDRKARRKLIVASILCVIFMIGEIIGERQIS
nr:uncharacterized protein LOC111514780 [Leptinotarsa decemlineata]